MPYHQRLIAEIKHTIMSTCVETEQAVHTQKRKVHQGHILYFAIEQDRPWNPRSVLMFQLEPCEGHTFKLLWCCCCCPSWHKVLFARSLCLLFNVVFSSNTALDTLTVFPHAAPLVFDWQGESSAHFATSLHQFCYWDIYVPLSANASLTSKGINWPGRIPAGSKYFRKKVFKMSQQKLPLKISAM